MDDASDRIYEQRESIWDEQMPLADRSASHGGNESDVENELMPFPDTVGTTDPLVSVRDAEPYSPPIDAPVLPGGREGIHVATGFGMSTEEEDAGELAPRGDEALHDHAMRLLADDSLTSTLDLDVRVADGVIRLYGTVASADDAEHAQYMLGEIPGVVDVVDDTRLNSQA